MNWQNHIKNKIYMNKILNNNFKESIAHNYLRILQKSYKSQSNQHCAQLRARLRT